ncbi:MAG: thioredoxin family protein [Pseudomonadota bacterium]
MKRRVFLTALPAFTLSAGFGHAAGETLDYTPGLVETALENGETVLLEFSAVWCSTCARQKRVIGELRSTDPSYNRITFVRVDWDRYGRSDIARMLNVPRRSTLVLRKGDEELGRIVSGTSRTKIKELMDKGLSVTSS